MKTIATLLTLLAALTVAACNAPGSDGRYATHDRGNGTIDKALR